MSRLLNWQSWVALVFCSGFLCCSLVLMCSWSYKCVQRVWAARTGLRILRLRISRDTIWIWTVVGGFREERQRKNQYFLFYKQIIPNLVMPQLQKWQWKLQKSTLENTFLFGNAGLLFFPQLPPMKLKRDWTKSWTSVFLLCYRKCSSYHQSGENSHFHCRKYTQEFLREVVNSFMV